jgi:hypothetical protein
MDVTLFYDVTFCNALLNDMSMYIYDSKLFEDMPETMKSARKLAKHYIKIAQLYITFHIISITPYLQECMNHLSLLDHNGIIHEHATFHRAMSFNASDEPLLEKYVRSLRTLKKLIHTWMHDMSVLSLTIMDGQMIKKLSFEVVETTCLQLKEEIRTFTKKKDELFKDSMHLLEALIEKRKLDKLIQKLVELNQE